jgi:D-3-phosphoglycerate dehydrogenase
MAKILITDDIAEEGIAILKGSGFEVTYKPGLKQPEVIAAIPGQDGLIVRSGTKVTKEVIEAGTSLRAIGRAGIGVDNVHLETATRRGIVVMNTPFGNVASAAEHTFALMLSLARNIPRGDATLRQGVWKRNELVGVEFEGKTLGIVGLGKIGGEVAHFAKAFHMKVMAYDPYLSRERAAELGIELTTLEAILEAADFLTFHVPLNDKTRNLIGAEQFKKMKRTARIVNCARGGVIHEAALAEALKAGTIAGAALDVYEKEPLDPKSPLIGLPNIVLTPHLGASTEEALLKVSVDVADQFVRFFKDGTVTHAVNAPAAVDPVLLPYVALAGTLGALAGQIGGERLTAVEVTINGAIAAHDPKPLVVSALAGVLKPVCGDTVNQVNAKLIAQDRGVTVSERHTQDIRTYANLLTIRIDSNTGPCLVAGTLLEGRDPRVVRIDDYDVDLRLAEHLLVMRYPDRPGMVGKIGTILGAHRINIAAMDVARQSRGGEALVVLTLDDPVTSTIVAELKKELAVDRAWAVRF